MIIPVTDPDDPRIAGYRAIRERDLSGRAGQFVLEGEVILRAAFDLGRFQLDSILIGANRLEPQADLLMRAPDGAPIYVAERAVLDAIAGFPMHRGILALGRRLPEPDAASLLRDLPDRARVLAICGVTNHDNMGGLFRNAAAFGVNAILIDAASCDPLYRKAIRVSAGAALIVPYARGKTPAALAETLLAAGFEVFATSPRGTRPLTEIAPGRRQAVMLGAEGTGLPADILASLDSLRIDMAGGFDSLNVAVTAGIILHHLR